MGSTAGSRISKHISKIELQTRIRIVGTSLISDHSLLSDNSLSKQLGALAAESSAVTAQSGTTEFWSVLTIALLDTIIDLN